MIYKYKNRKLTLELQQKQEKNLTENDNMNRQSKSTFNKKPRLIQSGTSTDPTQNTFIQAKITQNQANRLI